MNIRSIGPFQPSQVPDFNDLQITAERLSQEKQSKGEVQEDSQSQDSMADQENRGFVQILDFLARRRKKAFGALKSPQELALHKYGQLDRTEAHLAERGQILNRSI